MSKQVDLDEVLLKVDTTLTEKALEKFNDGELSQDELKRFYEQLSGWSMASSSLLDVIEKMAIRPAVFSCDNHKC